MNILRLIREVFIHFIVGTNSVIGNINYIYTSRTGERNGRDMEGNGRDMEGNLHFVNYW